MPNYSTRERKTSPPKQSRKHASNLPATSKPNAAAPSAEPQEFIYPDVPETQAVLAMLLAHKGFWISEHELQLFYGGDLNGDLDALVELGCSITRRYQWNGHIEILWVRLNRAPRNLYPLPVECPPSLKELTKRSRYCE
jgi:hypothetical protein